MIRSHRHRPDNSVVIVVLRHIYYSLEGTGNTYAVAAHPDKLVLLVLILVDRFHRLRILGSQLEYLPYLNTSGMAHRRAADRTLVTFLKGFEINYHIPFIVSSIVHVDIVMILFAGSRAKVPKPRKLAVYNYLAIVKVHRSGKAPHTARRCRHLIFIGKFDSVFGDTKGIYQLSHVKLSVSTDKYRHISVFLSFCIVGYKQQRLDGLLLIQLKEGGNLVNGLCVRSIYLFQRQHFHILLRSGIYASSLFHGSRKVTAVAVCYLRLAVFAQGGKLVGIGASDGTGVSLNRAEIKPAACEYVAVCFKHLVIAFVKARSVLVKGVVILHNKNS